MFVGDVVKMLRTIGLDVPRAAVSIAHVPRYIDGLLRYRRAARDTSFPLRLTSIAPMLADFTEQAGSASGHYFHQDLWAARKIYRARPARHVDVGSRIDGFVAHVLTFMPVEIIDIRRLESSVQGLTFVQADATTLDGFGDDSVPSVSSLHAAEHFGLGRYGDPIDPDGSSKVMGALARVVAPGGRLYFSVPVGRQRLAFNAQRIFAPGSVLQHFRSLRLGSFSYVDDEGQFHEDRAPSDASHLRCGCGLFEFDK